MAVPSSFTQGIASKVALSTAPTLVTPTCWFPGGSDSKREIHLQCRRPRLDPWVRKIPLRRKWQPTPVFLPGKSHGQRSLVGYSPLDCKESDMPEQLRLHIVSPYHSDVLEGANSVYYSPGIVLCLAQC